MGLFFWCVCTMLATMSIRTSRVGEEIQKVLSARLVRGVRDPLPGFVTIAGVEVTSDFSLAKVFVSVIGTDKEKQQAIALLTQSKGMMRYEVGQAVRLRQTPDLRFVLDDSGERGARVLRLLDEVRASTPPLAPTTGAAPPSPPSAMAQLGAVTLAAKPQRTPRPRAAAARKSPKGRA